jgi:hypothetical protein
MHWTPLGSTIQGLLKQSNINPNNKHPSQIDIEFVDEKIGRARGSSSFDRMELQEDYNIQRGNDKILNQIMNMKHQEGQNSRMSKIFDSG